MYRRVMTKTSSFEAPVWENISGEWKPLFGSFEHTGVSVEWHDFECEETLDWSRSFHPGSMEICINLEGCGTIRDRSSQTTVVNPQSVTHYSVGSDRLQADRHAAQRHRFLTVEMTRNWLAGAVLGYETHLNTDTRKFLDGSVKRGSARELPLNAGVRRTAEEMVKPPIDGPGAAVWYHAKILEIAAYTLTEPVGELFCQRHKRLAQDRVERVKRALARDLENPPSLTDLGREVGCSPFYLSRVFSEQTGLTISRYLRNLRLERASELLRTGECNVTEAAMAVGYSSLSHFSKAFAEMYGACPCVFPLKRRKRQRAASKTLVKA
jgi:AraC-like DNA-binding protein